MHLAKLQGELAGDTPQERFQDFIRRLEEPRTVLGYLNEYPVLGRLVVETLSRWEAFSVEALTHLAEDWSLLSDTFHKGNDLGALVEVSGGAGDRHRNGRSVLLLRFDSGLKLVYKPRSLAIDVRFGELLAWLEAQGAEELRVAETLDRGEYGWSEFVVATACQSQEEVRRFYGRQGALLALLHVLNANDFHRENLIARGEHPVLIDLESLCGPDYGRSDPESFDSAADYQLANSVMRVMMLPFFHEGVANHVVDQSGLGGEGGQDSTVATPFWVQAGTDEMRLEYSHEQIGEAQNRPQLEDKPIDTIEYAPEIEAGFTSMYRLLMDRRQELLAPNSPLSALSRCEVRSILRTSQFYGLILRESYHPELMADALERERHFDRLWHGIDRTSFPDVARRLHAHERRDLYRDDISYFTTTANSKELIASDGKALSDFFIATGMEMVQARLANLSEEHLREQIWYVRASLTGLAMDNSPKMPRYESVEGEGDVSQERLIAEATKIGEHLASLTKWDSKGASWLGLAWTLHRRWTLRPLEWDLYSGLPGLALFFAHLGRITGRGDFEKLAREALATLDLQLDRRQSSLDIAGGFEGWGGLIHTWASVGQLWDEPSWTDRAVAAVPELAALVPQDQTFDVARGISGAITPLLHLYRQTGDPRALEVARQIGDRLLSVARPFGPGLGWTTLMSPVEPLAGFSHGNGGIAWALTELYAETGHEEYLATALAGIAYENSLFYPPKSNWADLRVKLAEPLERKAFMTAWCHGATGIGLGRLRMWQIAPGPQGEHDLNAALKATVVNGFGGNHCLCHGDFGNLDLLLKVSEALPNSEWPRETHRWTQRVMASVEELGWLSGVPLRVETPGLLNGLAGIGYQMLRLAKPEDVPSILLLEGPLDPASTKGEPGNS